jgi:hypothetical protein
MMRLNTGIVCVVAALAAGACSWGSGSGSSTPGPDAPIGGGDVVCGDSVCAASEVGHCQQDCGSTGSNNPQQAVCGNGQCETTLGESATSCPSDCGGGQGSGGGSGSGGGGGGQLDCNDPNTLVACFACIATNVCTPPADAASCQACLGGGLSLCTGGAPDGTCDAMEDSTTCPDDCP